MDPRTPFICHYEVFCDEDWNTGIVNVGCDTRSLSLTVRSGVWRSGDRVLPELTGLLDIDLGVTPATNTLPLRRLLLAEGERVAVTAAWVQFPGLEIQPLHQSYTRLAANRYLYESANGFSAEIVVDDDGLVELYAGGWERVSAPAPWRQI